MKYVICIDQTEPIETIHTENVLSEQQRQAMAKDFCKRHDIGSSGVCVCHLPETQPIVKAVSDKKIH